MSIENLVIELSKDPFNPNVNFDLAEQYLALNQSASAVSFYLRCVEYSGQGDAKAYASLLHMAQCFDDQNGREFSVSNCLLQAIAYIPTRPEAYFKLSQFHEKMGNWQESYTYAVMGLAHTDDGQVLPSDVNYFGRYCLLFQQYIAAWWIGRKDESIDGLKSLFTMKMNQNYLDAVNYNLHKLNALL
jgi:hypothetical protein